MKPDAISDFEALRPAPVKSIPPRLSPFVSIARNLRQVLPRLGVDLMAMGRQADKRRAMQRQIFETAIDNLPREERLRLGIERFSVL